MLFMFNRSINPFRLYKSFICELVKTGTYYTAYYLIPCQLTPQLSFRSPQHLKAHIICRKTLVVLSCKYAAKLRLIGAGTRALLKY